MNETTLYPITSWQLGILRTYLDYAAANKIKIRTTHIQIPGGNLVVSYIDNDELKTDSIPQESNFIPCDLCGLIGGHFAYCCRSNESIQNTSWNK